MFPLRTAVCLVVLALVSCVAPHAANPAPRMGDFTLLSIGGEHVIEGSDVRLSFDGEGGVRGYTGVNSLTGTWDPDGERLFGPIATTRRMGPPELAEQEQRFLAALSAATIYTSTIIGDFIISRAYSPEMTLVLRASAAPEHAAR